MKKLLLTTTALAFAGSAFASDVSGYLGNGYQDKKEDGEGKKSLYTEAEVYVSGSKTASNGITFGADYTIGHYGGSNSNASDSKGGSVKTSGGSITSVDLPKNSSSIYNQVNAFVSSSFGRLDMGTHNSASRSHGATVTSVGNGSMNAGDTEYNTRQKAHDSITYSTPSFNGISAAYTMNPTKNAASSWAVNYMGEVAGVGLAAAYGTHTPGSEPEAEKKGSNNAWGIKVSKMGFSGSFGMGTVKMKNIGTEKDAKATRFGVGYATGKMAVGFSQKSVKDSGDETIDIKTTKFSASYEVASGLTAYAQQTKAGTVKTLLIGTVIDF